MFILTTIQADLEGEGGREGGREREREREREKERERVHTQNMICIYILVYRALGLVLYVGGCAHVYLSTDQVRCFAVYRHIMLVTFGQTLGDVVLQYCCNSLHVHEATVYMYKYDIEYTYTHVECVPVPAGCRCL